MRSLPSFLRALRLRCPACGGGPVFVSWVRMCPSCPSCGIRFDREPEGGYWVGSNTINLFATEATFAGKRELTRPVHLHPKIGFESHVFPSPTVH